MIKEWFLEQKAAFLESTFGKNVLMIAGGTIFAQALNIVASPVITRLYSPEEFGLLTVYVAILGIICLLGDLSFNSAIPIAENDKKAINILALSFAVLFLTTVFLIVLIWFFGKEIFHFIDGTQLLNYRMLMILGFSFSGIYTILTSWAYRKRNFSAITKTKFSQSITGNATKIGLGFLGFGSLGLILGQLFNQSAGITTLLLPIFKKESDLFKSISISEILWVAKRYIRFPLFSAPSLLLLSLSSRLPAVFISSIYGYKTVGFFGLAFSIVFLPMGLIGKAFQDVFYSEAAKIGKNNPKRVRDLSNKLLRKLIIVASLPTIALLFWGPWLFSLVFGSDWLIAGEYARILSILSFSYLIFHPVSVVFGIFEQQGYSLLLSTLRLVIVFAVFSLSSILSLDVSNMIIIFTASMSMMELLKYFLAQRIMNNAQQ